MPSVNINIASIAPALKEMSDDVLRPQFEQAHEAYNLFAEGDGQFVNGKGFRIPSYLRPPTGITGGAEGFSFNQPGSFTLDDMYVYPYSVAQAFEITGDTLQNVGDSSSLIKGLRGIMEMVSTALRKELNVQVFNDGSGLRARAASVSGATVTLQAAPGTTPGAEFGSTKGAYNMQVGEVYDFYQESDDTLLASGVRVTAKTATTVDTSPSIASVTAGDYFVPTGSLLKLPRGLAYIVNNDTGIFQLQSRNTYPELKSVVTDLNGAAIAVADFTKTKNLLQVRSGGKAKKVLALLSFAQDDALRRLGQNYKYFDGNAKSYDGSFDSFAHGDTVFRKDVDCDEDRIYLVVPTEIKRYTRRPFGVVDEDGNTLRMKSGSTGYGSDAFTGAIMVKYNLGTPEPRCHALIKRASVVGLANAASA